MLSGATWSAAAIAGTAVFRSVVSSDSIKNATAINHGSSRLLESASTGGTEFGSIGLCGVTLGGLGCIILRNGESRSSARGTDYDCCASPWRSALVVACWYLITDA